MKRVEYILEYIVLLLLGCAFVILITVIIASIKTKDLKNEIEYLESRIEYYQNNEDWYEDYFDLLEYIWEQEVEIAVLEERLKNQPSNEEYIEQIIDDFELTIELQQYYYQENITSHSFGDWLQINYPELYKRIESYF